MFDPDRRHLIAYLAAAAVLVVFVSRYLARDDGADPVPSISMAAPASARPAGARPRDGTASKSQLIWVDVVGAVRRPGLYSLPKDARVAAALMRAGGTTARANRVAVNLAAKLVDGQQIFVPRRGPGGGAASPGGAATSGAAPASGTVGVPSGGGVASGTGGPGPGGAPISLSTATQAELETLDGIGPALAQRIIEFRDQRGGFQSIEQLREVSGIGDKRFAALKSRITP